MSYALIPAIVGALTSAVASIVGRTAIASGVGFVTYKGIDIALGVLKTQVITSVSSFPGQIVGMIGYLWIDKGLTLIFSAFVAALSLKLVGGALKKAVLK